MKAQDLKNSILQLAIQGKLVPQDPNDEPASVLLEKIKAEKAELIKQGKIKKEKQESYIFRGDDNKYYEQIGSETKDITDEIPFDIPNNWEWVRLSYVCKLDNGNKINNVELPLLDAKYLRKKADKTIITSGIFVDYMDYLILVDGENSGEVFRAPEQGIMGSTFKKLYICNSLHDVYVLYILKFYQNMFRNSKKGAAIPHLDKQLFSSLLIGLPPLAEQKRIVKKIEELEPFVEEYGKAETELTALNNNFPEQIKKSILQYAIQGKLVEQDPNDEPASELLKKIKAEKAELVKQGKIKKDKQESYIFKGDDNRHYEKIGSETKDITEEIPFEIPNSWEWVRLGNVINLVSGRDLTPDCYSDLPINDGVPYITGASNIENEQVIVNRWTAKPQTLAYKGDLLLTCKGTVGLIAFLQCESAHIARQIMSLKAFSCIDMDYLKYFVLSYIAELQRKAKSMIPGISRDDVLQTLCPIPPYKEQLRIIQKLSKLLKIIDIL